MSRPYLLAAMARSGSDWLAENIARSLPGLRYRRELFSPGRRVEDPQTLRQLARVFGHDSEPLFKNICRDWREQSGELETIVSQTWARAGCDFTKEIWVAFKLGFFAPRFAVFVLYRHRKHTFPGRSKPRITRSAYSYIDRSLRENQIDDAEIRTLVALAERHARTDAQREVCAHLIYSLQQIKETLAHAIPILDYGCLMTIASPGELREYLRQRLPEGLLSEDLVAGLLSTRQPALAAEKAELYRETGLESACEPLLDHIRTDAALDFLRA